MGIAPRAQPQPTNFTINPIPVGWVEQSETQQNTLNPDVHTNLHVGYRATRSTATYECTVIRKLTSTHTLGIALRAQPQPTNFTINPIPVGWVEQSETQQNRATQTHQTFMLGIAPRAQPQPTNFTIHPIPVGWVEQSETQHKNHPTFS